MLSIDLTTPWDPGSADPGKTYDKCVVVNCYINPIMKYINLFYTKGYFVDGQFFSGVGLIPEQRQINIESYDALAIACSTGAGEQYFEGVLRLMLQWLIDQGHVQGTIS